MKKHLVVLTGAGISAESGLKTFRDSDGLWENHRVEDVATPDGWKRNPELVLKFYNERRKQVKQAKPNLAHKYLAQLEQKFTVSIITQNIDDLHQRAGSSFVLHLHGEIMKAQSTIDENLVYGINKDILMGDKCSKNSQLRPYVVWFGEPVPKFAEAEKLVSKADILLIVGTSLAVYPAAYLAKLAVNATDTYVIDPDSGLSLDGATIICKKATDGVRYLIERWLTNG